MRKLDTSWMHGNARRLTIVLSLILVSFTCVSAAETQRTSTTSNPETSSMKIRLSINGKTINATLTDTATSRDFIALLPMTLTLEDYASTEKIAYLPKKLSTEGAPAGIDPEIGDITYYAPWGNLAIFYRDFSYSSGLIRLGRIDTGVEVLNGRGSLNVTIEAFGKK